MSYIFPWSFLKVRLSLQPPFPIWQSSGPERHVPKSSSEDVLPCPQTRVPAAICSLLPWFLILPEQKCDVASRGSGCSRCHGPPWPAGRVTACSGLGVCAAVGAQHPRGTLRPFHRNPPTFKASTAWQTTETKAKILIQQCHASPYLGLTFQALSSPLWSAEVREKIKWTWPRTTDLLISKLQTAWTLQLILKWIRTKS